MNKILKKTVIAVLVITVAISNIYVSGEDKLFSVSATELEKEKREVVTPSTPFMYGDLTEEQKWIFDLLEEQYNRVENNVEIRLTKTIKEEDARKAVDVFEAHYMGDWHSLYVGINYLTSDEIILSFEPEEDQPFEDGDQDYGDDFEDDFEFGDEQDYRDYMDEIGQQLPDPSEETDEGEYEPVQCYATSFTISSIMYDYDKYEEKRVIFEESVAEIVNQIPTDATDYEKVKMICNILAEKTEYYYDTLEYREGTLTNWTDKQFERIQYSSTSYGAIVYGKAICSGYAAAVRELCHRVGVYCLYITGYTTPNGYHAWNLIFLDGEYYNVDVTWMDAEYSTPRYEYVLSTDEDISQSHFNAMYGECNDGRLKAPKAEGKEYCYFIQEGLYFENVADAWKYIEKLTELPEDGICFKFENEFDMYQFAHEVDVANDYKENKLFVDGKGYVPYGTISMNSARVVKVFFSSEDDFEW